MVAYSFKQRFIDPILAGTKRQTIRADRRRHAREGEEVQLYSGMRTKHCRLIARKVCLRVAPVSLTFAPDGRTFIIGGVTLVRSALAQFAINDGFESLDDMEMFWRGERQKPSGHEPWDMRGGPLTLTFVGVLIQWA